MKVSVYQEVPKTCARQVQLLFLLVLGAALFKECCLGMLLDALTLGDYNKKFVV